jgi:hypothetical protein
VQVAIGLHGTSTPTLSITDSVNQRLPLGPVAIAIGALTVGVGKSRIAGVQVAIGVQGTSNPNFPGLKLGEPHVTVRSRRDRR